MSGFGVYLWMRKLVIQAKTWLGRDGQRFPTVLRLVRSEIQGPRYIAVSILASLFYQSHPPFSGGLNANR